MNTSILEIHLSPSTFRAMKLKHRVLVQNRIHPSSLASDDGNEERRGEEEEQKKSTCLVGIKL